MSSAPIPLLSSPSSHEGQAPSGRPAREPARRRSTAFLLGAGVFLSGCGGASAGTSPAATTPTRPPTARQLLPLEHDTVFSYETTNDAGDQGLTILQIRRPRASLVELDIAGRVQRLDVDETSVMHAAGGYLLKDPISLGAGFRGAFGEVRVTELERTVQVPAGTFENCVATIEESQAPFKRAESVYCPGIGLVFLVVEGSGEGGDLVRVESRLKSYGPRVTFP